MRKGYLVAGRKGCRLIQVFFSLLVVIAHVMASAPGEPGIMSSVPGPSTSSSGMCHCSLPPHQIAMQSRNPYGESHSRLKPSLIAESSCNSTTYWARHTCVPIPYHHVVGRKVAGGAFAIQGSTPNWACSAAPATPSLRVLLKRGMLPLIS